jgi:hypothetical protein
MNISEIPYIATNRLLAYYKKYKRYRGGYESMYDYHLIEAIKIELDSREHVETKGRKHEKRKRDR